MFLEIKEFIPTNNGEDLQLAFYWSDDDTFEDAAEEIALDRASFENLLGAKVNIGDRFLISALSHVKFITGDEAKVEANS